ncbi:hypothetical protein ACE21V_002045 [Salmonella enterica]
MTTDTKRGDFSLPFSELKPDFQKILNGFSELLSQANASIFQNKSAHIRDLKYFEELFLRVRTGKCNLLGHTVLVISSISIKYTGQGIFSALLSELKNLSIQEGYMLKIENVLPPNFRVFLVREGFIFPGESWVCGSGYWLPESEVLKNGINSLPV